MAGLLSALRHLYLSLYNWTVFLGWFQVLHLALKTLSESGHQHVYNAVECHFLLAQSAAVLEIVHGLVGLVRYPVTATLPQIDSRFWSITEIEMQEQATSSLAASSLPSSNQRSSSSAFHLEVKETMDDSSTITASRSGVPHGCRCFFPIPTLVQGAHA
ncbi:hypothetical protein ACFX12_031853 [Malus domestica]